ncbi:TCP-1/cpn60 chaperonin family-domain-containing protein [Melanogaster broomeanus]|nr:TCP-1/cpn60 chaperonin family-domain-containing protein [Melanogaster broomeanus]
MALHVRFSPTYTSSGPPSHPSVFSPTSMFLALTVPNTQSACFGPTRALSVPHLLVFDPPATDPTYLFSTLPSLPSTFGPTHLLRKHSIASKGQELQTDIPQRHAQLTQSARTKAGPGTACILNKLRVDSRRLTGGTVFTNKLDIKLEKATPAVLGSTGSITITKEDTIFLNGEGSKDAIQAHCEQIRSLLADPSASEFDKTKLQERLAKLSGGVAVIKVGSSEVEVGEKKDRYEGALNATCAAVEEGILPGGGVALLKASLALTTSSPGSTNPPSNPNVKIVPTANFDQDLGVNIVRRALTNPACTILSNAGKESSVIVGTLNQYGSAENFAMGYDVASLDCRRAG